MLCSVRWDPNRESDIFFQQSVLLYTTYHEIQILIHKPFIPTPRVSSALSFPSLTICTSAARACTHIATLSSKRDKERGVLLPMCSLQVRSNRFDFVDEHFGVASCLHIGGSSVVEYLERPSFRYGVK